MGGGEYRGVLLVGFSWRIVDRCFGFPGCASEVRMVLTNRRQMTYRRGLFRLDGSSFCSPGASTRRTMGVFSLYLRSVTFPFSSLTRNANTGRLPSLAKSSRPTLTV